MTATSDEPALSTTRAEPRGPRLEAIDVIRGLAMIFMALDHTRDFFMSPAVSPTDLSKASAALFLTRWITHFCAPTFFFLTGTGAFLSLRTQSKREVSRFLLTRGLWLIALDAVILRCLSMQFNFDFHVTVLLVLWALGWSMIALSALIYLPTAAITTFGITLMAAHNLFDGVRAESFGSWAPLWNWLHSPGVLLNVPGHIVVVSYPVIPWIGVMAAGFGFGALYIRPAAQRRTALLRIGLAVTAAFIAVRALNVYGDPSHWTPQASGLTTVLSFLNTTKYPPSLLFLLMTLGPMMLLAAAIDGGTPRILKPALIVGKVPMFYYIVHFTLLHALAVAVCYAINGDAHWLFESPTIDKYPFVQPPNWGVSLGVVYRIWMSVVVLLFPVCRWFAGVKQRRRDWWLRYI